AYSVVDGGLHCAHCGYYEPPEKSVVGKGAQEFEFTVETMAIATQAQGWGTARKELQCQNCGARTSLPEGHLTHVCPFCGSNRVLQQDTPQDVLRPRFLVPFKIEVDACQQIARDWLGSNWMTPKSLKDVARIANFQGIYLPFWTFDATTKAQWRAQVGHTRTERYRSGGEWKTRTVTDWRWESGDVQRDFDDWVIPGTAKLSQLLLERIRKFDLLALVPYEPQYLAGFLAQAYDVMLESAWEHAREQMREDTRQVCRAQASTSQIRNFSMSLDFSNESWRYVLLPVYVAVYAYGGESYQVMLNGQTGEIAGQRPVDWTKVWWVVAALLAPGVLLGILGIITALLGVGIVVGIIALVLLVVGGIIAAIIVSAAMSMDDV
ncbi:MAG: DUF2975 domain-containing protein, partial [Anaerolineae bacterium]|nr:DUF2975 domain-containing protein [Anaerolineae bacterium]